MEICRRESIAQAGRSSPRVSVQIRIGISPSRETATGGNRLLPEMDEGSARLQLPADWRVLIVPALEVNATCTRSLNDSLEQERANADQRGALLDGDFKIAAHPHGKLLELEPAWPSRVQPITNQPQSFEGPPGIVQIAFAARHAHQADNRNVIESREWLAQRLYLVGPEAVLRGVA